MTDVHSRHLPAPRDWQAFERLAYDLFCQVWRTNDVSLHGRSGQGQQGVDLYGTDRFTGDGSGVFTGVQCKLKDAEHGEVTEKELRDEVGKALGFEPSLQAFVLITTAPDDSRIQAVARSITADHRKEGKFSVQVIGWGTLHQIIGRYADIVKAHFGQFAPIDVLERFDRIEAQIGVAQQKSEAILHRQDRIWMGIRDQGAGTDPLAETVTEIANQIADGSPVAALKALQRLWRDKESGATPLARFRILANIGNAHMALGAEADAIVAFEQAYAAYPEYANARATLAVARTFQGRRREALELAQGALKDDPTSRRAAGVIIDLLPVGTPLADVEAALTPDVLGHFEIKIGLSIRAQQAGNAAESLRYAEQALEAQPEDWRTLSCVGEALLAPLATKDIVTVAELLDANLEQALDRAIELNRHAWQLLAAQDSSFLGRHVAANLVAQLLLVGEDEAAYAILDEALPKNPDYPPLLQRAGQRAAGKGDWENARAIIARIPPDKRAFEDAMLAVQASMRLKDEKAAAIAVPDMIARAKTPDQIQYADALQAVVSVLNGADRLSTLDAALVSSPRSIIVRSVLLEFVEDREPHQSRIIDELRAEAASGSMSMRARALAAEAMMEVRDYSSAADLYEPLHRRRDCPVLFRRLQALHWADRRKEARALFESLPEAVRRKQKYRRLGVGIYEKAGLLMRAIGLVEASLAEVDRLGDRLVWMQLLVRMDDIRFVDWLRNVPESIDGSPRQLAMLAQFADRYLPGESKPFAIGYRALRLGYSDPEVHLAFAFGFFFRGSAQRANLKSPEAVGVGSGVILQDETGGDVRFYVIEAHACPAAERGELGPDHPLALDLLGKKEGDTVGIRQAGSGEQCYRIMEVQNSYVFAFQRTLRDFNRLFPGHLALGKLALDERQKASERFEPFFARARERAKHARNLEEMYDNQVIPLFMVAQFSGTAIVDVWEALRVRPDRYLKVALGFDQEFKQGRRASQAQLLIVDPLAIYGWVRLGLDKLMLKLGKKLAVVQSTLDLLRQIHAERESERGQGRASLGWDGEHYQMVEATAEIIEERIAEAKAAADLAAALTLVPAEGEGALRSDILGLIGEAHSAFADTLLASMFEKRALLTDDLGLRVIGQECGIDCAWTQVLLQSHVGADGISQEDYLDGLDALTMARYDFTQIGHKEILAELYRSGWVINDRLRRFAELMARPNVDRESLSTLLAQLVIDAQQSQPRDEQLVAFPNAYVDALRRAGARNDVRFVFQRTVEKMRQLFLALFKERDLRKNLLNSTSLVRPEALVDELDRLAIRAARAMRDNLVSGGISLS